MSNSLGSFFHEVSLDEMPMAVGYGDDDVPMVGKIRNKSVPVAAGKRIIEIPVGKIRNQGEEQGSVYDNRGILVL